MESRIRDGTRIDSPETFPFLVAVALFFSDDPSKYDLPLCSGSILSKVWQGFEPNFIQTLHNTYMHMIDTLHISVVLCPTFCY
jgi:hypothetical protein